MGSIHFFKPKKAKQEENLSQTCEGQIARLYHRLMVLKANERDSVFPIQTVIEQTKQDIAQLQTMIGDMVSVQFNQAISLSSLEQKVDNLRKCRLLFSKVIETNEPPLKESVSLKNEYA